MQVRHWHDSGAAPRCLHKMPEGTRKPDGMFYASTTTLQAAGAPSTLRSVLATNTWSSSSNGQRPEHKCCSTGSHAHIWRNIRSVSRDVLTHPAMWVVCAAAKVACVVLPPTIVTKCQCWRLATGDPSKKKHRCQCRVKRSTWGHGSSYQGTKHSIERPIRLVGPLADHPR